MKPMTKCLDFNLRTGRTININEIVDTIESEFKCALDATIDCNDSYDEVSNESYNDLLILKAKLIILNRCGYIDTEELNNMANLASDIRTDKLEKLNKKEGEN